MMNRNAEFLPASLRILKEAELHPSHEVTSKASVTRGFTRPIEP